MAKYIRKPHIVHAWKNDSDCLIETHDGTNITPGDWIIIDDNGVIDCCPDIDFSDMYAPFDESKVKPAVVVVRKVDRVPFTVDDD